MPRLELSFWFLGAERPFIIEPVNVFFMPPFWAIVWCTPYPAEVLNGKG